MLSKEWKLLLLVPLSLAFLTACPDKNRESESTQASTYSGVWVNQDLLSIWSTYTTNGRNLLTSQTEMEEFCTELFYESNKYGVGFDTRLRRLRLIIDSWVVSSAGEVFYFNPTANLSDPRYREGHFHGQIDHQGVFTRRDQLNRAQTIHTQNYSRPFAMSARSRVIRSEQTLKVVYEDRGTRNYHLSAESQLLEIYVAVEKCTTIYDFTRAPGYGTPGHGRIERGHYYGPQTETIERERHGVYTEEEEVYGPREPRQPPEREIPPEDRYYGPQQPAREPAYK